MGNSCCSIQKGDYQIGELNMPNQEEKQQNPIEYKKHNQKLQNTLLSDFGETQENGKECSNFISNLRQPISSQEKYNQLTQFFSDHLLEVEELPYEDSLQNQAQLLVANDQIPQKYFTNEEEQEILINEQTQRNSNKREFRKYFFTNGAVYEGEFIKNKRDGQGTMTWADKATFTGEWKTNKANGKGVFTHSNGDTYEGNWIKNKASGYGVFKGQQSSYEGEWIDDLQDGKGIEIWNDKSYFEGFYRQGKKSGQGKYVWSDNSSYEGNFVDNRMDGQGVYKWPDGRIYTGQFKNNLLHGKGVYKWPDGRIYEGEYQFERKHGFGKFTYPNGNINEGYWEFGQIVQQNH